MQKKMLFAVFIFSMLTGCNIVIQDSVFDQQEFLGERVNDPQIYAADSDSSFISPFQINVDNNGLGDMQRLLLWEFKPHTNYNSVEIQTLSINDTTGYLVLLYMADRDQVDVYHSPGLSPNENVYKAMLNNCVLTASDFEYRFKVDSLGLDAYLHLTDRFGNDIECRAREAFADRKYVNLLAPIGGESKEPDFLPIVFLKQFRLLSREHTDLWVTINNSHCKMTIFPAKMNGEKVFFSKYSTEPVNSNWNAEYDGVLPKFYPDKENIVADGDTRIYLSFVNSHPEITKFSGVRNGHETSFSFSPPIPDLLNLKDDVELNGCFALSVDDVQGVLGGVYHIQRTGEMIQIHAQPTLGYSPVPGKAWMKKMLWEADIHIGSENISMTSKWSKHK